VFAVGDDPVKLGLVASLARPGGNATGITTLAQEVDAKRLALLHEVVPKAVRVAALLNPTNATNAETTLEHVQEAARVIGLQLQVLRASTSREIDAAFATFGRERSDALFVTGDAFFGSRLVQLANGNRPGIVASLARPGGNATLTQGLRGLGWTEGRDVRQTD
jgi:putative ABC transport system substrate-binding protein